MHLITTTAGQPVTTSLVIAEKFGKRHDTVLRSIRKLECSAEFRLRNFAESSYLNEQGKEQPSFDITRDGMESGLHYKDIYQLAKQRVEAIANMIGKSLPGEQLPRLRYAA